MPVLTQNILGEIERLPPVHIYGQVTGVLGMLVEVSGVQGHLSIGDHCRIEARTGKQVLC